MLWAYLLLALTTAPPLIPNSALLVTGGVLAAHGQLDIGLVLLVVAGSALAGDLVIHRGGRALSSPLLSRLYRRPRRRRLLEWTASRIRRHGIPFVVLCRFLPSGRLVGGLAAGVVRYPTRRYLVGAGIAEVVWATYSVGIGYLGGRTTANPLYAIALGIGVSLAVAGAGSLVQFAAGRRARSDEPAPPPAPEAASPPARAGSTAVRVHCLDRPAAAEPLTGSGLVGSARSAGPPPPARRLERGP